MRSGQATTLDVAEHLFVVVEHRSGQRLESHPFAGKRWRGNEKVQVNHIADASAGRRAINVDAR